MKYLSVFLAAITFIFPMFQKIYPNTYMIVFFYIGIFGLFFKCISQCLQSQKINTDKFFPTGHDLINEAKKDSGVIKEICSNERIISYYSESTKSLNAVNNESAESIAKAELYFHYIISSISIVVLLAIIDRTGILELLGGIFYG